MTTLFKRALDWSLRGVEDYGFLPLESAYVRRLLVDGAEMMLREAYAASEVVSGPLVVGSRIIEEREQRVIAMNAQPKLRIVAGGRS